MLKQQLTLDSGPALAILVIVALLMELTILENLLTWATDGKNPQWLGKLLLITTKQTRQLITTLASD